MRRARLRITYAFEPSKLPLELHTRMVRTLEYEFTGVARILDRIYLREHLKRKTAFALTKLQGLVRREAADGSLRHAGQRREAREAAVCTTAIGTNCALYRGRHRARAAPRFCIDRAGALPAPRAGQGERYPVSSPRTIRGRRFLWGANGL
jgi:hypothetical protein